jgi:hypothetical protein
MAALTPLDDDGIVVWRSRKRHEMVDEREEERLLSLAAERFERRLAQEISGFRVEVARDFAKVRVEIHEGDAGLRVEMHEGFASLRQAIGGMRVELLKWSLLFWVGQVAAMAGLLAFMLRSVGR